MQILEFQPYAEHVRLVWRWWSHIAIERGRPPRRGEVDPAAFLPALHKVWLVEWLAESDCFRYRLAGEDINRTHGFSLKGRTLEEVFPGPTRARIDAAWREVLGQPAISYQVGQIYLDGQTTRHGERLVLPLLDDRTKTAGYLLGITSHPKGLPEEEAVESLSLQPNFNHSFFSLKELLAKKA
ncbi:MAG: PAS domain-containing protein [Rhodovibrionaceae bacterium]